MTSAIEIKKNKFETAKNKLKEFSKKLPDPVTLSTVETKSLLIFDRSVTGAELNRLTKDIQTQFIAINKNITKTFQEFGQVYETLDTLDKEYIQSILLAIKAAEDASAEAKDSAAAAIRNTKDIESSMQALEQIIKILDQFKRKIDQYKHLENIEEIWEDTHNLKKDVSSTKNHIKDIKVSFDKVNSKNNEKIDFLTKNLETSNDFFNKVNSKSNEKIENLTKNLKTSNEIWHKVNLENNDKIEALTKNLIKTNELLDKVHLENKDRVEALARNLKISYVISGVAIGSALLGITLGIMGII